MSLLSQKALLLYSCLLLVSTVLYTSTSATGSRDICTTVQGALPYSLIPTVSIPVYATGTSATLNVIARSNFVINLQQNDTKYPPVNTGYQFLIGGWTNTGSRLRTARGPYTSGAGTAWVAKSGAYLSASSYRALWISWTNGVIAIGTGSVVGLNGFMEYTSQSGEPINYLLIGCMDYGAEFSLTYCFDPRYVDLSLPSNAPVKLISTCTALDCGRRCVDDPKCQGYAMARNGVIVTTCRIYYSISSLVFDADHITYLKRSP